MKDKLGGLLISKINFISGRIFSKLIKKRKSLEINNSQGRILFILSKFKEMPINNLCEELSLSKSTLTSMLDKLEFSGYIVKKVNDLDKRSTLINLTQKGKVAVELYSKTIEEMEKVYYKGFSEKEIYLFESYLNRIYTNLKSKDEEKERQYG